MKIPYRLKSLSLKLLSESEISLIKDIPIKKFVVQQSSVEGFAKNAVEKATSSFTWIPKETLTKLQSSLPLMLSWFAPGETINLLVQVVMEIAGFPIASRSLFVIQITKG